jgi:hypothetical protein
MVLPCLVEHGYRVYSGPQKWRQNLGKQNKQNIKFHILFSVGRRTSIPKLAKDHPLEKRQCHCRSLAYVNSKVGGLSA